MFNHISTPWKNIILNYIKFIPIHLYILTHFIIYLRDIYEYIYVMWQLNVFVMKKINLRAKPNHKSISNEQATDDVCAYITVGGAYSSA